MYDGDYDNGQWHSHTCHGTVITKSQSGKNERHKPPLSFHAYPHQVLLATITALLTFSIKEEIFQNPDFQTPQASSSSKSHHPRFHKSTNEPPTTNHSILLTLILYWILYLLR